MIFDKSAIDLFLFNDFLQINEFMFFISLFLAQHTSYYYKPTLTVFLLYMTIIIISGYTFPDWLLPPVKTASTELRCLRVALLRPTVARERWDSWRSCVLRWGGSSSEVAIRAVCLSFATEIATFGCKANQSVKFSQWWRYCSTIERTEECFPDHWCIDEYGIL